MADQKPSSIAICWKRWAPSLRNSDALGQRARALRGRAPRRLLDRLGASGTRLIAVALNDYSAELPIEDIRKYEVILALKQNGEYMPVQNKGPLFIVYNFDSDPELKNQKFYSRSVWQVAKLEVR